jgi:hypothetical protein
MPHDLFQALLLRLIAPDVLLPLLFPDLLGNLLPDEYFPRTWLLLCPTIPSAIDFASRMSHPSFLAIICMLLPFMPQAKQLKMFCLVLKLALACESLWNGHLTFT